VANDTYYEDSVPIEDRIARGLVRCKMSKQQPKENRLLFESHCAVGERSESSHWIVPNQGVENDAADAHSSKAMTSCERYRLMLMHVDLVHHKGMDEAMRERASPVSSADALTSTSCLHSSE
jgi:hypothetical protein